MPANMLLVVIDDLGTDYVGCYRQNPNAPATPVLDSLAQKGIRFTNAYANPVCTPTRACLMTGRHAFRSGMEVTCMPGDLGMRDEEWTLPEAMGSLGYSCALIGKWHLGDRHGAMTPNVQGWPHFVGALYGNIPSYTNWQKTRNGVSVQATTYATSDQVNESIAWISQQRAPWMLMLSFHAPHTPLHAPPQSLHSQNLTGRNPATSPTLFYKAMIESVDTELGRLIASLGPGRNNTNILVISDNGTPSGLALAPPSRAKGSLYQAGIKVPMIFTGPAVVRPGRVASDRVHAIDVFPTIWALGSGTPQNALATFDGASLMPILRDMPAPARPVYSETIGTGFGSGCQRMEGGFKLIRFSDDPVMMPHEEFYDLGADPTESVDLIARGMTAAERQAYDALSGGLWQMRLRGHIQSYGIDCPTSVGSVRLKSYAPPSLGVMHYMSVLTPGVGANNVTFPCSVAVGADIPNWNGTQLPAALDPLGMTGCMLRARPEIIIYGGPTDSLFGLPTPSDPSMLGATLCAQAFVADPAANPAGLAASAGYRFTLGIW